MFANVWQLEWFIEREIEELIIYSIFFWALSQDEVGERAATY
jgi:hypothetical protein